MYLTYKSRVITCVFFLCCLFGASQITFAEKNDQISKPKTDNVLKYLTTARPDLEFSIVGQTPMPGIYEVQVKNGPVLFVHEAGQYLLQGDLLQVTANEIISTMEVRETSKRRELFAKRSTDDMIIFKPAGESKAIMNVFTDVDCGYCRKFHQEVPQLNAMGIEVRYLAFPRAGIPSGSYNKIAKAWCAEDKQDTLTKVKNGRNVDIEVCDNNPVAEHYSFGNSIGVTGTPAIILMDGTLIPGYQPAASFAKLLGISSK